MTQKNVFTRNGKRGILPFHEPVQMFPIWERRPKEQIMFIGLDDQDDLEPLWIQVPADELVLEEGLVDVELDLEATRTAIWKVASKIFTTPVIGYTTLSYEDFLTAEPDDEFRITVLTEGGYQPLNIQFTAKISDLTFLGWVNHLK